MQGSVLRRRRAAGIALAVLGTIAVTGAAARASFVTFESGQVRPLALAPDGSRLYAVNTPDNRLEIFTIDGAGALTHAGAVPVGLEPVAVAARPGTDEVWVVNHLSDSISIVDAAATPPRVVRTLLVGDEPRDVVFAGPGGQRAFVTTAHRGQNTPFHANIDTILRTEGIGRADVWVFDAADLGTSLGGTPLTIVTLFGDTPRALTVSPDGSTVYAAVFHSGNQTTTVSEGVVCDDTNLNNNAVPGPCTILGTTYPGGLPLPEKSADGVPRPETGLVVKFDPVSGQWRDQLGRNWNNAVRFNLPDEDVFAIDATANPPVHVAGPGGTFTGVGTVLFNMATNPVTGTVYVSNTEARNEVRFEGPGILGGSTVRGHLHEARITVLDGTTVTPRHLNKHIDYDTVPSPPGTANDSLATPLDMAVSSDGSTLYVAAFGSDKVGVYGTTALETDSFDPATVPHITVSGGGPSGLVLDESRDRLYVFTRFDNAISVIDTDTHAELAHVPVYNPEPPHVVAGRRFLYDAFLTSSNGEAACAACHIFGDFDSLAWDLGNPDDTVLDNLNPFEVVDPLGISFPDHHPMKGPMTTQSLRGMAHHGPMHWRGDRSGANEPGGSAYDEDAAFKRFNVAFEGLLGREQPLTPAQMQAFTDFILEVTYPPNPIRALDNSLTPDQQAGRNFYFGPNSDVFRNCNGCHVLNPAQGFFGGDGDSSFENEAQLFKVPHLRNMYQKIGMFGMPAIQFLNAGDNAHKGDQIRGFGFLHDGSVDTLFRFHQAAVFNQCVPGFGCINPGGFPNGAAGDTLRRQVESFMFAFDSNLAPIVGQQITLTDSNGATAGPRIALLRQRAGAPYPTVGLPGARECDLVVKGVVNGELRGWLYQPGTNSYRSDRASEPLISNASLSALANTPGQPLTFTCVPPGSGQRIGIDRDEDGAFDRDELDACSDPSDPNSLPTPGGCGVACRTPARSKLLLKADAGREKLVWRWTKGEATDPTDFGDPVGGSTAYTLRVFSGSAGTMVMEVEVPAQGTCGGKPCWKATATGYKYKDAAAANDGVRVIGLKAGAPGKAKVSVTGKGSNLPVPALPPSGLALPVTVQLRSSDDECWAATYLDAKRNDDRQFKAKF